MKILSYVSKINKNKREIISLSQKLMKNLKISFSKEENKIKYEEYCFNGIPIPINIEFKDIGTTNFQLKWDLEKANFENNEIKYKIELRKENEKFSKVYEGNNTYCTIDNLNFNTNYEIRICSIYKDLEGEWTKIQKVKTLDFDSNILKQEERGGVFLEKIYEWSGYKKMELIYRATRDGSTSQDFHNKCDNQGPTICLYQNEKRNIFGGFTSISWTNSGEINLTLIVLFSL